MKYFELISIEMDKSKIAGKPSKNAVPTNSNKIDSLVNKVLGDKELMNKIYTNFRSTLIDKFPEIIQESVSSKELAQKLDIGKPPSNFNVMILKRAFAKNPKAVNAICTEVIINSLKK